MKWVYIGKGLRVLTTQLLIWDKRSEKQRVGSKEMRVRTLYGREGCIGLMGKGLRRSRGVND